MILVMRPKINQTSMGNRRVTARTSPRPRNAPETLPPTQRSAITNGKRLTIEGDGNSAWYRRYKDLICGHISDLGGRDILRGDARGRDGGFRKELAAGVNLKTMSAFGGKADIHRRAASTSSVAIDPTRT
jgi:hypothetical protein